MRFHLHVRFPAELHVYNFPRLIYVTMRGVLLSKMEIKLVYSPMEQSKITARMHAEIVMVNDIYS